MIQKALEDQNLYDMIISDIKMPKMSGTDLLDRMNECRIPCPVVFITAFATIDSAVEAMRRGAVDYITKPFEEERIHLTVERTLNLSRIITENRNLKKELQEAAAGAEEIVFVSSTMKDVMCLAAKVAKSDSAVLISGESGTGKELLSKYIHRGGKRSQGKFVPVNCAAISPNLVESELFGHEKGSFTGADKRAVGKFEYASGGTIFLDEIGDLPMEAQAKLLRALQEKKIQRVGGNEEIPVDSRLICATNKNLEELVEKEAFRQDLFFRINVFPLEPPPLRDRLEDVEVLTDHFLKRLGAPNMKVSKGAYKVLKSYHWPGNVRELANAIERSVILESESGEITEETLAFLKPASPVDCEKLSFQLPAEGIVMEDFEKDLVKQALEAAGNNQTAAARLLGLSRAKFRVLMKQASKK
jgi:DNA-binding NtrC family response regulator